jgi:hypothetical protein
MGVKREIRPQGTFVGFGELDIGEFHKGSLNPGIRLRFVLIVEFDFSFLKQVFVNIRNRGYFYIVHVECHAFQYDSLTENLLELFYLGEFFRLILHYKRLSLDKTVKMG